MLLFKKISVYWSILIALGVLAAVHVLNQGVERATIITPSVLTVTSNISLPIYRTKYITQIVTVNNEVASSIIVTTANAEELAVHMQNDLLHFEHDPLTVQIQPYEIKNNRPETEIEASANLYYRSWKLKIHNDAGVVYEEPPLNINIAYGLSSSRVALGLSKQLFELFNIPIQGGVNINL